MHRVARGWHGRRLSYFAIMAYWQNFMALAASGYYDNTIFHRNIKTFMVQGGDPTGVLYSSSSHQPSAHFRQRQRWTVNMGRAVSG